MSSSVSCISVCGGSSQVDKGWSSGGSARWGRDRSLPPSLQAMAKVVEVCSSIPEEHLFIEINS